MFHCLKNLRRVGLWLALGLLVAPRAEATDSTYVRFNTSLGNIDVQLLSDEAPKNVANFMGYVTGATINYNNSIIHRSVPGFVIQGGGYNFVGNSLTAIAANPPTVMGEHGASYPNAFSNVRGTLAMALSSGPDSGTDEWFFNLADNSTALDGTADGGPFTVFGVVANASSLAVMDAIAAVQTFNYGSPFDALPLSNFTMAEYNANDSVPLADFIYVKSITTLTTTDFATWEAVPFAGQPASVSAPTATPQDDGVPNLIKYLCDVTPMQTMPATDLAKLPKAGLATISGAKYATLVYRQRANLVGVFVSVETSTNLQTWAAPTNATTTQTTTTDGTGDTIIQVAVPAPTKGGQFFRLNVTP
jgi:cyclophilin family peptidyl-prolyl cis-trans isomerase